jgi:hypothetical protein
MTQVVLAIDPGKTGAIAAFFKGEPGRVHPATATDLRDCILTARDASFTFRVVIEQVNGAPGQSGPASFNFGRAYGELLGVCIALDVEPVLIRPADWKAGLGLRRDYGESNAAFKRKSLVMARNVWPQHAKAFFARAKDDGAAEAALLGLYALQQGIV